MGYKGIAPVPRDASGVDGVWGNTLHGSAWRHPSSERVHRCESTVTAPRPLYTDCLRHIHEIQQQKSRNVTGQHSALFTILRPPYTDPTLRGVQDFKRCVHWEKNTVHIINQVFFFLLRSEDRIGIFSLFVIYFFSYFLHSTVTSNWGSITGDFIGGTIDGRRYLDHKLYCWIIVSPTWTRVVSKFFPWSTFNDSYVCTK